MVTINKCPIIIQHEQRYFKITIKHVYVCYESVVPDNGNMIKIMLNILRSITVCPD